jgi:hypothetical protein
MLGIIFTFMLVLPFLKKTMLSLAQKVIISDNNMASIAFLNSGEAPHSDAKLVEPQLLHTSDDTDIFVPHELQILFL